MVISYPNGIKVLSLLSGQPITRLEFPATNDIHFDIDGDGEVEKLMWDFGKVFMSSFDSDMFESSCFCFHLQWLMNNFPFSNWFHSAVVIKCVEKCHSYFKQIMCDAWKFTMFE